MREIVLFILLTCLVSLEYWHLFFHEKDVGYVKMYTVEWHGAGPPDIHFVPEGEITLLRCTSTVCGLSPYRYWNEDDDRGFSSLRPTGIKP